MLSIGLVYALVTGSALLRVRQELFDKPSEQRLRVAASHLSHGDCVTSAGHRRRAHFALLGLRLRHGCLSRCAQQLQCRRRPPSSGGTANGRWCPRACRGRVASADPVSYHHMSLTDKSKILSRDLFTRNHITHERCGPIKTRTRTTRKTSRRAHQRRAGRPNESSRTRRCRAMTLAFGAAARAAHRGSSGTLETASRLPSRPHAPDGAGHGCGLSGRRRDRGRWTPRHSTWPSASRCIHTQ